MSAGVLMRAKDVGVRFGRTDVVRAIDAAISTGSQTAMTGRSGSGKTTLLLVFSGLILPTSGTVTWPGLHSGMRERRAQIGMVFQAPSLMPELTALQNVTLPLRMAGVDVQKAARDAISALHAIGADDLHEALPFQLSGGQQQRVAIARVLAGGHRLVLADEPTGALDRAHAHDAVRALRDGVAAAGGALLVATHDLEIAAMFDRRMAVDAGRLTAGAAR